VKILAIRAVSAVQQAVRAALKVRLGDGDQLSLSGYWAAGRTEDAFQSEKRQPIGQI
jgi:NADPH-dependent ferric siderophore reductase